MSSAAHLSVAASRRFGDLRGDLIDGIAEAVASPPDPHARAAAISSVVQEVYETMEWLHGVGIENEELASLHRIVEEAQEHARRMSLLRDQAPVATSPASLVPLP
jgi:hypothetical protein